MQSPEAEPRPTVVQDPGGCSAPLISMVLLSFALCAVIPLANLRFSLVGVQVDVIDTATLKTLQLGRTDPDSMLPSDGYTFLWVEAGLHNTDGATRAIHLDQFTMEQQDVGYQPLSYWPVGSATYEPGIARVMDVVLDRTLEAGETMTVDLLFEVPSDLSDTALRFRSLNEKYFHHDLEVDLKSTRRVDELRLENEGEDRLQLVEAATGFEFVRLRLRLHNGASTRRALVADDFQLIRGEVRQTPMAAVPRQLEDVGGRLAVASEIPDAALDPGATKDIDLIFEMPVGEDTTVLEVIGEERSGVWGDWVYGLMGSEDTLRMVLTQEQGPMQQHVNDH